MKTIWRRSEATVEEVRQDLAEQGTALALPSIRKMLSILQEKGYLTRRPEGRGHAYRTVVTETQAHNKFVKDLVERAFEGSALGLVATLFKADLVSEEEIRQVKVLIARYEKEKD